MRKIIAILFTLILLIPLHVWGNSFNWDPNALSLFLLFPLLGLLAFSIMWTQVLVVAFEMSLKTHINLDKFFSKTGLAVLILFISHPLIALFALYLNQGSLNPFNLVSESHAIFIVLALIAFTTFIAFEVVNRANKAKLQKFRPIVEYASYIGVILVWIHSYNIGTHTQTGWFKYLWLFYGITALLMIASIFYQKLIKIKKSIY